MSRHWQEANAVAELQLGLSGRKWDDGGPVPKEADEVAVRSRSSSVRQ